MTDIWIQCSICTAYVITTFICVAIMMMMLMIIIMMVMTGLLGWSM